MYFVMQIELRMQIRPGPSEAREGEKREAQMVPSFPEQGTVGKGFAEESDALRTLQPQSWATGH